MITIDPYASDSSLRYKTKQCVPTSVWCAHTASNNQRKPIANLPSPRYVMRLQTALKWSRAIWITTHTAQKKSTCDVNKGWKHAYQRLYNSFACFSCPRAALKWNLRYSAHQNYMIARYAVVGGTASVAFTCASLTGGFRSPKETGVFFSPLFIPLPIDLPKCGRREPNPCHLVSSATPFPVTYHGGSVHHWTASTVVIIITCKATQRTSTRNAEYGPPS